MIRNFLIAAIFGIAACLAVIAVFSLISDPRPRITPYTFFCVDSDNNITFQLGVDQAELVDVSAEKHWKLTLNGQSVIMDTVPPNSVCQVITTLSP